MPRISHSTPMAHFLYSHAHFFLFTCTVLLCNSSYHMISRLQYNSYWLAILNLLNFEFGGCFFLLLLGPFNNGNLANAARLRSR